MDLFYATFVFFCLIAAIYDFLIYKIPNIVVGGIIILFLAKYIIFQGIVGLYYPVGVFFATIIVGLLLFRLGLLGGGDAKFFSACAMWAAEVGFFNFFILTALLGGGIALIYIVGGNALNIVRIKILLGVRKIIGLKKAVDIFGPIEAFKEGKKTTFILASGKVIPYGIAIALASYFSIYLVRFG